MPLCPKCDVGFNPEFKPCLDFHSADIILQTTLPSSCPPFSPNCAVCAPGVQASRVSQAAEAQPGHQSKEDGAGLQGTVLLTRTASVAEPGCMAVGYVWALGGVCEHTDMSNLGWMTLYVSEYYT